MDTPKTLTQEKALAIVRKYKKIISPRFDGKIKVYMYGSYSNGYANPWSDIDVAVIVPQVKEGEWLSTSVSLCHDMRKVSTLIEPVLMQENDSSPLYRDVMRTGIAV